LAHAYFTALLVGIASDIDYAARVTGKTPASNRFEPITWMLYEKAGRNKASDYSLAFQTLHRIARDIAGFLETYDVWLTPTLAEPPVPLGTFESEEASMRVMRRVGEFVPFTQVCNVTGQPAMSVPLYWNSEGLPIGTQFVGRFGDEATLFRLASQLESARPWADRRPPLSV
jgi:Asp-tRNA(Asn)/Glu-tRNA(Gln) amidotransferase A subunit family amidase